MDKSVDSIGSCSLDVDAEITDFTDTSGSVNFSTPVSVKDIVRDFTLNIQERSLYIAPTKSVSSNGKAFCRTVMSETNGGSIYLEESSNSINEDCAAHTDKKPSYLNLACSVNGYSNLTTYDSKIRQDINKSREVSPIRISTKALPYCKPSNSLQPPVLLTMPHIEYTKPKADSSNGLANGSNWIEEPTTSFIQQRVERLYGPGALAQGFYSPRKSPNPNRLKVNNQTEESELARKFNELSPNKDYNQLKKKINAMKTNETSDIVKTVFAEDRGIMELPVFRHLSEEFRAQLPVSPKKNFSRASPVKESSNISNLSKCHNGNESPGDIPNTAKDNFPTIDETDKTVNVQNAKSIEIANGLLSDAIESNDIRKGTYFLELLKEEQDRLLLLAEKADKYTNSLLDNDQISDDVMGLLRSASGKARLLVSQKMKQFEGLCHNNLKSSAEEKFPTTNDDLQGFWDMVHLQIDHIDTIFKEIEKLKSNDWQNVVEEEPKIYSQTKTQKQVKTTSNSAKTNGKGSAAKEAANSAAALKREMQRKQLLEMKRKKRLELASTQKNTSSENANVDFDALSPNISNKQLREPATTNNALA